ncbi:MAG: transcriptional repressor [Desulfobulbus sp.]|nr:transcriptional repressor [Desulfobulbus sp.]
MTHQRLEIYHELLKAHDHPSAEALYKRLGKRLPSLSLDTVYRTLATFEKLKLAHRVDTAESQARFEAITARHHHFLCSACGQLVDFFWQDFDDVLLPSDLTTIGSVDCTKVVAHGTCVVCTRKTQRSDKGGQAAFSLSS